MKDSAMIELALESWRFAETFNNILPKLDREEYMRYQEEIAAQAHWAAEKARAQALEEGLNEGRKEKAIEMVKNLLVANTPLKYIVAATGWPEDKILKLAEEN